MVIKKKNYIIIYIIRKKKKNLYLLFSTLLLSFKWINKSVKFKQIDNVHLIRCVHVGQCINWWNVKGASTLFFSMLRSCLGFNHCIYINTYVCHLSETLMEEFLSFMTWRYDSTKIVKKKSHILSCQCTLYFHICTWYIHSFARKLCEPVPTPEFSQISGDDDSRKYPLKFHFYFLNY